MKTNTPYLNYKAIIAGLVSLVLLLSLAFVAPAFAQESGKVILEADSQGVHFSVMDTVCTLNGKTFPNAKVLILTYEGKSVSGCIAVEDGNVVGIVVDSAGETHLMLLNAVEFHTPGGSDV
jgi:hypothetical protein